MKINQIWLNASTGKLGLWFLCMTKDIHCETACSHTVFKYTASTRYMRQYNDASPVLRSLPHGQGTTALLQLDICYTSKVSSILHQHFGVLAVQVGLVQISF